MENLIEEIEKLISDKKLAYDERKVVKLIYLLRKEKNQKRKNEIVNEIRQLCYGRFIGAIKYYSKRFGFKFSNVKEKILIQADDLFCEELLTLEDCIKNYDKLLGDFKNYLGVALMQKISDTIIKLELSVNFKTRNYGDGEYKTIQNKIKKNIQISKDEHFNFEGEHFNFEEDFGGKEKDLGLFVNLESNEFKEIERLYLNKFSSLEKFIYKNLIMGIGKGKMSNQELLGRWNKNIKLETLTKIIKRIKEKIKKLIE